MLEILKFIFRDFWTWAGTAVLLAIVAQGLITAVGIIVTGRKE